MARTVYVTTELTGAGSGLDGINGNVIVAGDFAFHINRDTTKLAGHGGNYFGLYMATTDAAAESSPETLVPDVNPGSWNWEHLSPLMSVFHTTGMASTLPNFGVSVIRTTGASVHMLKAPRRGTYKKLVFATTQLIKIRLSTAAAAYTVKIGQAKKLTAASTMCVIISSSKSAGWGGVLKIPNIIELGGRTTSCWEILNQATTKKSFTFSSST